MACIGHLFFVPLLHNQLNTKIMEKKYYRLFDTQTGDYMATGYNATSLEELKNDLWEYGEPDNEEIYLTTDSSKIELQTLIDVNELVLEDSDEPFEEYD